MSAALNRFQVSNDDLELRTLKTALSFARVDLPFFLREISFTKEKQKGENSINSELTPKEILYSCVFLLWGFTSFSNFFKGAVYSAVQWLSLH